MTFQYRIQFQNTYWKYIYALPCISITWVEQTAHYQHGTWDYRVIKKGQRPHLLINYFQRTGLDLRGLWEHRRVYSSLENLYTISEFSVNVKTKKNH